MVKELIEIDSNIERWHKERNIQEASHKKHMSFYLPMPLYKIVKSHCAQQNKTMTRYLMVALVEKIKRESL